MLSRHFLRSKVLQLAYAANTDNVDVVEAEKSFKHHISRLNDLGVLQLSMLEHFVEVAGVMMDEAQHKFMPTEADRNPNYRLLNNRLLRKLVDNYDYRRHIKDAGVNWGGVEYDEIFRQSYAGLVRMPIYREYLEGKDDFAHDQDFAIKLFKYLINYPQLCEAIYPQSLLWEDDYDQIAQYDYKILKSIDETFDEASVVPLVCDLRDEADKEAYEFARLLLISTLRHREEVEGMIRQNLQGWEFDRVAGMDILLLNMAVAELTECPSIPERVTVDEYIELSKEFSSERSRLFINGILGKFIMILRSAGRIKKTGRGVIGFAEGEEEENGMEGVYEVPSDEAPVPVVTVRKTRPRIKRTLALCLLLLAGLTACRGSQGDGEVGVDLIQNPNSAEGYDQSAAMPEMTFDCDMHDFGRLSEGESISYSFHFRNTGKADLVISGCNASCGCTVADYPRKRIAPGEEGYIAVSFNSQGKVGQQYQEVTVLSNAQPSRHVLKIVAQVTH